MRRRPLCPALALVCALLVPLACASTHDEPLDRGAVTDAGNSPASPLAAQAEPVAAAPAAPAPPAWKPRPEDDVAPHQPLENPEALAQFYEDIAKLDDGERTDVIKVVHLGASMIGMDDLTSILRGSFQTRFGDGGAGLVLLQRYMTNYIHRGVKLQASGWKNCYIGYLCMKDGHYGLGGVTFWSDGGATTTISTRQGKEFGTEASHFEVWYLADKGAGNMKVQVDDQEPIKIDTNEDAKADRFHEIDTEQGPHSITLRATGGGRARAYGMVLETKGPGITWDQFSMLGAFTKRIQAWDPAHIAGQIAQRDPSLIVFTYGGNDVRRVALGKVTHEKYVEEYLGGIKPVLAGKPEASCLIIGMTDRGKSLNYTIEPKDVEVIVAAQRETAEKAGCAFFDTYAAMGGGGALKRWLRKKPPLAAPDLKHLTHEGRKIFGGWVYDSIMRGYVDHRKAKQG